MSHTSDVKMIADSEIELLGNKVDLHDITALIVDYLGQIVDYMLRGGGWHLLELEPEPAQLRDRIIKIEERLDKAGF